MASGVERLIGDDWLIVMRLHESRCSVEFETYAVAGRAGMEADASLLYERKGWKSSADITTNRAEAETHSTGFIKWDACGHVTLTNPYTHICGYEHAQSYAEMVVALYDMARETMGETAENGGMWPVRP